MKLVTKIVSFAVMTLMATTSFAFNVEWHGDLNHRFMYSTQADVNIGYDDLFNYINIRDARQVEGSSHMRSGLVDTKKSKKDSDYFGELKYRLWVDASDDQKRIRGVIGVEIGGNDFGAKDADFGGDQKGDLEFRWGYIDMEVPYMENSRLSVGLQPVGYNYWVWGDNAAGVKWTTSMENLTYTFGWYRDDEQNDGMGGDDRSFNDNVFATDATYTFDNGNNLNAFFIYLDSGDETNENNFGEGSVGDLFGDDHVLTGVDEVQYWIGLGGNGQWDNLSARFTLVYEGGELETSNGQVFNGNEDELDRQAYMAHLEGTANYDKWTYKLGWFYASGDDNPEDDKVENFNSIDTWCDDFGSIIIYDGLADDNSFSFAPYILDRGNNTAYLHIDYAVTEKLTVGGRYIWLNTAEDMWKESDLGHEFGFDTSYKIMDGVKAALKIHYLVGGDAWDELASDGNGDDVFRTDFNIRYKF